MQIFTFTAVFTGYPNPAIFTAKSQAELDALVTQRFLRDEDFIGLMNRLADELPDLELSSDERKNAERWVETFQDRDTTGDFCVTEDLLNFLWNHLFELTPDVIDSYGYSISEEESQAEGTPTMQLALPSGLTEDQFKQMARRLREKLQKIANVDIGHSKSIQVLAESLYSKPFEEAKESILKQNGKAVESINAPAPAEIAPMKEYFSKSESEIAAMVAQGVLKAEQDYMDDRASREVQYAELRENNPYWLTIGIEQAHGKNALNSMLNFCLGESKVPEFLLALEKAGYSELVLPVIFEGESFGLDPSFFKNAEVFFITPSYREMISSEMKTFTRT